MKIKSWMEQKIKKMDWLDVGLIKWSCVVFGILLVVWIPELANINANLLLVLVLVLGFRPMYRYLLK